MSLKNQWSIQILADQNRNFLHVFVGAAKSYHPFLALVDPEGQIAAEMRFSGKNRQGVSFSGSNHLGRPAFNVASLFNALSEATGWGKLGSLYRRCLDIVFPNNDAPRLKACLHVNNGGAKLRNLSDIKTAGTRQYISFEGCESEVVGLWQKCCAVADRINRQNLIFTSYGIGLSATNCRAGTKAVVAQTLGQGFPYIGPNGRFDPRSPRSIWSLKDNIGYGRRLPVAEDTELFPLSQSSDTSEILMYWRSRLKKTCKDVSSLEIS